MFEKNASIYGNQTMMLLYNIDLRMSHLKSPPLHWIRWSNSFIPRTTSSCT